MTTLNTIIEEEIEFLFSGENEVGKFKHQGIGNCTKENITTSMQRAYEAGAEERDTYWKERVGKAVNDGYKLAVKHLEEAYQANATTTVPEIIEWLRDNARLSHQIDND